MQGDSAQQERAEAAGSSAQREPSAEDKPVRVRAGFQVYQPKPRVSRLSSADDNALAHVPDTAKPGAAAKSAKSGGTSGGAKTGGGAKSSASDAQPTAAKSGALFRCCCEFKPLQRH